MAGHIEKLNPQSFFCVCCCCCYQSYRIATVFTVDTICPERVQTCLPSELFSKTLSSLEQIAAKHRKQRKTLLSTACKVTWVYACCTSAPWAHPCTIGSTLLAVQWVPPPQTTFVLSSTFYFYLVSTRALNSAAHQPAASFLGCSSRVPGPPDLLLNAAPQYVLNGTQNHLPRCRVRICGSRSSASRSPTVNATHTYMHYLAIFYTGLLNRKQQKPFFWRFDG